MRKDFDFVIDLSSHHFAQNTMFCGFSQAELCFYYKKQPESAVL